MSAVDYTCLLFLLLFRFYYPSGYKRYDPAAKENTLRDTLVFGVASDKVRKDAIALGNSLTFRQVYDLAKVDESTKAQNNENNFQRRREI